MSKKKKIIITLSAICLVIAITVVGVFAFATQTFSISNRVSFIASDVTADISVSATNAGNVVTFADGANLLVPTEAEDEDNAPDTAVSWTVEASASSNQMTNKAIPDQTFAGAGSDNAVVYSITVTNRGSKAFAAKVKDETIASLATADNVDIVVTYSKTPHNGTAASSTNNATLAVGDSWTATFTYTLSDAGLNADVSVALNFALAAIE